MWVDLWKISTKNLRLENERTSHEWKWKASWWKVQRDGLKFVWERCRLRCGRIEGERNWKWGKNHRIQRILVLICCCCCSMMLIKALSINCRSDALLERIKTHCKIVFCSFLFIFEQFFFSFSSKFWFNFYAFLQSNLSVYCVDKSSILLFFHHFAIKFFRKLFLILFSTNSFFD